MQGIKQYLQQYTGLLRSLKVTYVINNWLNASQLKHNKALYKKYGIQKSIYSPIGAKDLPKGDALMAWVDQPDALQQMSQRPGWNQFAPEWQAAIRTFIEEGYLIIKGFYSINEVQTLNQEVDRLLEEHKTGFNYSGRKIMDAYKDSALIEKAYFQNPRLIQLLTFLQGKEIIPFQTIHFLKGSEQRAHSDSIHMATYPQGGMIACWTALEKVDDQNGTLLYYPGSHRWPYVTCEAYGAGNTFFKIGKDSNRKYENYMEKIIQESNVAPKKFYAEPGDILLWHANLVHGGSPILDPSRTRRSMVGHYYAKDVICYHEMTQRPSLLRVEGRG